MEQEEIKVEKMEKEDLIVLTLKQVFSNTLKLGEMIPPILV
jgi:hypothetical protein